MLFAPHGGRRLAARSPGQHKVNDLHTAELTRELADAWDAPAVINSSRDRNELDLNRRDQVRAEAPWLLATLGALLERAAAHHGAATLVVIHGWNVGQPACDVGIGVTAAQYAAGVPSDRCTVSRRFLADVLPRLQRAAAAENVLLTVGARYPAAHRNNLLQAFAAAGDDDGPLAAMARRGILDAVQLELGIPLRWQGPQRIALVRALTEALLPSIPAGRAALPAPSSLTPHSGPITRRLGLQFTAGPLVGLTSIDAGDTGPVAGRLLLSRGTATLALFTGELPSHDAETWRMPPLAYAPNADGSFELRYEGAILEFPCLTPFLDLENGLATGKLVSADVRLRVAAAPGLRTEYFATARGHVRLEDDVYDVDTVALVSAGGTAFGARPSRLRLVLPATPLGDLTLRADGRLDGTVATGARATLTGTAHHATSDPEPVSGSCEVRLDGTVGRATLAVRGAHGTTYTEAAHLDRLIPVRRPGRPGHVAHTTYARAIWPSNLVGVVEVTEEHPFHA